LGAFPALHGLIETLRTAGFSGPTPYRIVPATRSIFRANFRARRKPGFPLQSFLPQRGKKVFPLQSLARSVRWLYARKEQPLTKQSFRKPRPDKGDKSVLLFTYMFNYTLLVFDCQEKKAKNRIKGGFPKTPGKTNNGRPTINLI
jgi:hypothetical protein